MEYLNILLIGLTYVFTSVMYAALRSGESRDGMFKYFVEFLFWTMMAMIFISLLIRK